MSPSVGAAEQAIGVQLLQRGTAAGTTGGRHQGPTARPPPICNSNHVHTGPLCTAIGRERRACCTSCGAKSSISSAGAAGLVSAALARLDGPA